MNDLTSPLARSFGFLGGVAVAVSTLVAWYDYQVLIAAGRIVHLFEVPINLWSLYPLAAALLMAGALVAMALLAIPPVIAARAPSLVAALLGLGIGAYGAIRTFDTPDLGVNTGARSTIEAQTSMDAGPLLAFVGGAMIVVGALVVLVAAGRAARASDQRARPARSRHGGAAPPTPA
jgi:hypothetical protein